MHVSGSENCLSKTLITLPQFPNKNKQNKKQTNKASVVLEVNVAFWE